MIEAIFTIVLVTLTRATSLIFAGIGGVISEKAGVINIGLEGIMVVGAFAAVVGAHYTHSIILALLTAMICGGLIALVHAVLSIKFKTNQIVAGTAINIFAVGITSFLLKVIFGKPGNSPSVYSFSAVKMDFLTNIPVLGPFIQSQIPYSMVYLAFIVAILCHVVLYRTPIGLRIRAVGEHPQAADTAGVNVYVIRYGCVIASGVLAALGGAYLSIGQLSSFSEGMVSGRGFIALAAMIFGKWTPFGTVGACLFFGFFDVLQAMLQGRVPIPNEFMLSIPYVLTMIALLGVIGKSNPPAADGVPYEKGSR